MSCMFLAEQRVQNAIPGAHIILNTSISIQGDDRHLRCLVEMGCTCHTPNDILLSREKKQKNKKKAVKRLEMREETDT